MVKRILLPLAIVAGASLIAYWMLQIEETIDQKVKQEPVILVDIIQARKRTVNISVKAQGTVSPRTQTTLVSEVSGMITEVSPSFLVGGFFNKGDVLMLLSVVCWMAYALLIRTMLDRYSGFTLTFYATLFGVLILLLLAPQETPLGQIGEISRASLLSVLYMGVCGSGLGYLLYNLSIREIGPTRTSSFVYSVIPLIVAGLAWLFFQQAITSIMVASMVLILIGLRLMLTVTQRPLAETQ